MARSIIKAIFLLVLLSTTSCSTIMSEVMSSVVESDISYGINNTKPGVTDKTKKKQKEKDDAQLKASGKCPVCKGMGKSADGKYSCETCKGTGNYIVTNNNLE